MSKPKLSNELSKEIETFDPNGLKKVISRDGGETALVRDKTLASEYHAVAGSVTDCGTLPYLIWIFSSKESVHKPLQRSCSE